jgi:uncharacterized protein (TIGR03435 family)
MTPKTKVAITTGAVILILAATALMWKMFSTPPLKHSDFFLGDKSPPNLVVIRPTHFIRPEDQMGDSSAQFKNAAGKEVKYISGLGVSFQELIEGAYGNDPQFVSEARFVFPPNVPTIKFDYLVTTPDKPEDHLQAEIKRQLGYSAHWETRNTNVLALKVETPDASGLQISTNTIRRYRNWMLTHYQIGIIVETLESCLKQPVLNETGLTNFYDFRWSFAPTNRVQINGSLANLGLSLEPTHEPVQMLIVEKVR